MELSTAIRKLIAVIVDTYKPEFENLSEADKKHFRNLEKCLEVLG